MIPDDRYRFWLSLLRFGREPQGVCANVAGIMYTERIFRPYYQRILERILVVLRVIFGKDYSLVTVGIAQISMKCWMDKHSCGWFVALVRSMSFRENFILCSEIVERFGTSDTAAIALLYNGSDGSYYTKLLKHNVDMFLNFNDAALGGGK